MQVKPKDILSLYFSLFQAQVFQAGRWAAVVW